MLSLEEIRPSVERLITAVTHSLKLDVAVFDSDSSLFFGTPTYLKKKGRAVHAPFIREVISNGSILVNKPGEMAACIGCRFKDHCPSTIEVLCSIHAGSHIAGVISFTSFTKDGQRRITEHTPVYLNAITELAALLGEMVRGKSGESGTTSSARLLEGALEICSHPLLLVDAHGVILQFNQMAVSALKFCSVASSSLWQIFSEDVVRKILEGNDLFEKSVTVGNMATRVTTKTIEAGDQDRMILVRLSDDWYQSQLDPGSFGRIVGESQQIQTVHRLIQKVADSPTPILLSGETGTGKELVARAIHEQGKRGKYPFIAINCSSIPENLLESELFGYEEGSFTGARKGGKAGRVEMAQGGTLFLDEVGEIPLSVQPKLLRVLQEYELERVGSVKKIHLDIRIIAATNRDLADMVKQRRFREDLYYRINVIHIKLPPLRIRRNDILPIAQNYLEKLKARVNSNLKSISPQVIEFFLSYPWPGNVRELQNVMEYAANLCETDTMTLSDLPAEMLGQTLEMQRNQSEGQLSSSALRELTEKYGCTLEGKKQMAGELGISLRTLYRWIERLK